MTESLPNWLPVLAFSVTVLFILWVTVRTARNSRTVRTKNIALRQEREIIFDFVHHIGDVFADVNQMDEEPLLKRILFFAARTGKASAGAIYLLNKKTDQMYARAVSGIFPPLYDTQDVETDQIIAKSRQLEAQIKNRPIALGEGLIGSAASVGSGIIIEDAELDARVPTYTSNSLKIRSLVILPMRFGNEVLGVLALINRTDGKLFTPGDLNLLQAMADQASVPIHYAGLRAALDEKRQIDRDMLVAQQIQTSLLPQRFPQTENVEMAAFNLPAFDIGGDYYDFIEIDEDHLGIAIADVAGKGIGGAMMMAVCQGVLRTRAPQERSPARMLSELNRVLSENLAEDMLIPMIYMVLNTKTRELNFARAGHEPPILWRPSKQHPEPVGGKGIAIGLANTEVFDTVIEDVSIHLEAGDTILAYTDGITEAMNEENEEWGLKSLNRTIAETRLSGINSLINNIRTELTAYVGKQRQYDDITLLAFKIR